MLFFFCQKNFLPFMCLSQNFTHLFKSHLKYHFLHEKSVSSCYLKLWKHNLWILLCYNLPLLYNRVIDVLELFLFTDFNLLWGTIPIRSRESLHSYSSTDFVCMTQRLTLDSSSQISLGKIYKQIKYVFMVLKCSRNFIFCFLFLSKSGGR